MVFWLWSRSCSTPITTCQYFNFIISTNGSLKNIGRRQKSLAYQNSFGRSYVWIQPLRLHRYWWPFHAKNRLWGHKTFFHTQLSMKFFLLINIKMPTIVGILIFISRNNFMLSSAVQEESVNCWYLFIFFFFGRTNFILSWDEHEKKFYNLGPWTALCSDLNLSSMTGSFLIFKGIKNTW